MLDGILRRKQSRIMSRLDDPHEGSNRRIGATYARVSSIKQKDGISLDDQERKMLLYAEAEGIHIPEQYRFREAFSGLKDEREEYEQIRRLITEARINVLIV